MVPFVNKWLGLLGMMAAIAMIFTDQSILPVALPTIREQLHLSDNVLQWCVNAYILAIAVFVLVGGKLGDLFGSRRVYCIGLFLFAGASACCALSFHGALLILSRILQGLGASLMFPNSTTLIMSLFPPQERGKANGINVSAGSIFLILGPLLGGFIVERYTWPWIFWVNIPLALVSFCLVLLNVPKPPLREGKIDTCGFAYFATAMVSFVLLLMNGREWGWTSPSILSLSALTLLSGILLLRREQKAAHPFLELTLFRHPHFSAAVIGVAATAFVLSITVFWALYFQDALHYSPFKTGIITFFSSLPIIVFSPIAGHISDRYGVRPPIAFGFACLIFSFAWMAHFNDNSLSWMLPGLFTFGIGVTSVFTPIYSAVTFTISPHKWGIAYGIIATFRAVAGALGIALIGTSMEEIQTWSMRHTSLIESMKIAFAATNGLLSLLLLGAFVLVLTLYNKTFKNI